MNRKAVLLAAPLLLLNPTAGMGQNLLDFGSFDLRVTALREIETFTGERGEVIRPSRRDVKFVEVTIEATTNAEGEFALYPTMFSALFVRRGVTQTTPARALGTKVTDRGTGQVTEYWYHDPGVSVIIGVGAGEAFRRYLVLEIPKEVDAFLVQGPKTIPQGGRDQALGDR